MSSGTDIITLIGMIGLALLAFLFIKNKVARLRREKAIRVHGIKTTAEIKEIEQAGANEFRTRVRLRVLVEDQKGGRYYAQAVVSIENTHMPQFQPGCKIDVAYDPANPKNVVVLSPTSGRLTAVKANTQESWQEGVQESYKLVLDDPGYDRANVTKILGKILFEQVQSLDPLSHSSQNLIKSSMLSTRHTPSLIMSGLSKSEADLCKIRLESEGAKVQVYAQDENIMVKHVLRQNGPMIIARGSVLSNHETGHQRIVMGSTLNEKRAQIAVTRPDGTVFETSYPSYTMHLKPGQKLKVFYELDQERNIDVIVYKKGYLIIRAVLVLIPSLLILLVILFWLFPASH